MTKQGSKQAASPLILEAQERLFSLRAHLRSTRGRQATPPGERPASRELISSTSGQNAALNISDLPDHLGWGSHRKTDQLRRALLNQHRPHTVLKSDLQWLDKITSSKPPTPAEEERKPEPAAPIFNPKESSVKLYPDIGLGLLRRKVTAPGRLWLLLRWLDDAGSGQMDIQFVRQVICSQESAVKICGLRQLRSLLGKGDGVFWTRSQDKVWLKSAAKVAHNLEIKRLSGHPVDMPVRALLGNIGQVRAHFYASFHSGRKEGKPISRAALSNISQVSPRSQQNYEKRVKVQIQRNYAIGARLGDEKAKDQGWHHGSACFTWHDSQGALDSAKNERIAWQLPNSYSGPHKKRSKGRQRQINRLLAVLSNKGMTGNDHQNDKNLSRRYFNRASGAAKGLESGRGPVYWQSGHPGRWFFLENSVV